MCRCGRNTVTDYSLLCLNGWHGFPLLWRRLLFQKNSASFSHAVALSINKRKATAAEHFVTLLPQCPLPDTLEIIVCLKYLRGCVIKIQ
jgi:hypothetical protein